MQPYYKKTNQVFLKKSKIYFPYRIHFNLPKISASFKQSVSLSGRFFDTSTNIPKLCFILSQNVGGGALESVSIGLTERNLEKSEVSVGGAISEIKKIVTI
jgi:phage tail tube protein FII